MRLSNLQAMAYKNSQCRAAWSGHCLSTPTHHDSQGGRGCILCDSTSERHFKPDKCHVTL